MAHENKLLSFVVRPWEVAKYYKKENIVHLTNKELLSKIFLSIFYEYEPSDGWR